MSYECERCDRRFYQWRHLEQHKRDSFNHHICYECDKDFSTREGLIQHYTQSRRHWYCQRCDEHFDDETELEEHYDDCHWYCSPCGKFFKNEYGLREHYRQSDQHPYCYECDRHFLSFSNLDSHRKSSTHRPKDVKCPGCDQSFVSISALTLHLESGGCRSGINRQIVDRRVISLDTSNIITNPSRLITGPSSGDIFGRDASPIIATSAAFNGHGFECYFCHNQYPSLVSLNQHLASPKHLEKIYRCPKDDCRLQFKVLSALCQHIESGSCGVNKFKQVQDVMDKLITGVKRLTAA